MSKSINKVQSNILLNKMQERPEFARGFSKENKGKVAQFWKQLTVELNSSEPPIKSESDWKKAWNDQKRYVRRKASANKMYERGTGGGPNKTQKLSPSEETIFQLIGMKEAVEGVKAAKSFGITKFGKRKKSCDENVLPLGVEEVWECTSGDILNEDPASISAPLCKAVETAIRYQQVKLTNTVPLQEVEDFNSASPTATPCNTNKVDEPNILQKIPHKMTTKEVALKELKIQQEVCNKIGEATELIKSHNGEIQKSYKKIYRSLDRIYHQQKLHFQEQKRHGMEMEKLK